jgi:hypothetical protein
MHSRLSKPKQGCYHKDMSIITARPSIPDTWGEKAQCPLCATRGLFVHQQPEQPDQLRCPKCRLAFEVENGGARLHVARWPAALEELDGLTKDWLTVAELRELAKKVVSAPATPQTASVPIRSKSEGLAPGPERPVKAAISDETIMRVKALRDLGNSEYQVRQILLGEGKTLAEVQATISAANEMDKKDRSRQQRKLWRSLTATMLALFVCIGSGVLLQSGFSDNKPEIIANAQASVAPQAADALHLNTPVVQYAPNPPAAASVITGCPGNAEEAAMLFGGKSFNWKSPPGSNGWFMIDIEQGNSIYVPSNMTAAYMELGAAINLVEIRGPVTMQDVYYIAISCP